jgi:HEAT repeat protein
VERAFENQQINDFRIYYLLDAALADSYAALAEYIETTVIPSIGAPIIPFLLKGFSYEGKTDDIRRFRLLYKLGYKGIPKMIDKIFSGDSSAQLRATAVRSLGDGGLVSFGNNLENETVLIKFTGDKHSVVRFAAYEALANLNTERAQRTLIELFIENKRKQDSQELSRILETMQMPDIF